MVGWLVVNVVIPVVDDDTPLVVGILVVVVGWLVVVDDTPVVVEEVVEVEVDETPDVVD